ncbi:hypothetical protein E4T56_gene15439 [Termitomyces sp. T112]|nr:hypothetical protein E4T56_gene15439 [Termitomyces sp. T112]
MLKIVLSNKWVLSELWLVYATKLLPAFLLQDSAPTQVILVEGLSNREHQRQGIQEVQISKGERPSTTYVDGYVLSNLSLVLFPVLSSTGRALSRAPAHSYLALGPIYFGVVLAEPCEIEDHVLPTQAGNGKNSMLHMIPIMEDKVDYGADGTCFVGCSIDVVNWNGL